MNQVYAQLRDVLLRQYFFTANCCDSQALDVDARHLQDDFAANTLDVDWIPEIGRRGWVVITGDRGISKKPAERKALEEAKVIAIFMANGFTTKPIFELISLFIRWWPEIERTASRVVPGTSIQVNPNGKVELL